MEPDFRNHWHRLPKRNWPWKPEDQDRLFAIKKELSVTLDRVCFRTGRTQREIAFWIGTHPSRLSYARGSNLEKVTVNQLIRYLIMTEPHFRILVAI